MEEARRLVEETIRRFGMLRPGDLVLVGVSGGADSLALLHILWSLRASLDISLHVAHLDHRLRAEAAEEAEFVRRTAAELGLPVTVAEADVAALARRRRISLEEAGREARYAFFRRLREETGARRLALGHNRDDLAETVLMRFLRGTGAWGLAGIPPVREGWIIRPLLCVPRAAVERYCRAAGLVPRRDATNLDVSLLRNRVRHRILPFLVREANPRLPEALARLAELVREDEEWLAEVVAERFAAVGRADPDAVVFPLASFAPLPAGLQRRLIRQACARLGWLPGPDFAAVERALALLGGRTGRRAVLGGGLEAWRERDALTVARRREEAPFSHVLPLPGEVTVPEAGLRLEARLLSPRGGAAGGTVSPGEVLLAAEGLTGPLTVRSRRDGDRLWLPGRAGPTRLKRLLARWGIPRRLRDRIPLVTARLASGEEVLLWVVGRAADARFQPRPGDESLLLLRCVELPDAIC